MVNEGAGIIGSQREGDIAAPCGSPTNENYLINMASERNNDNDVEYIDPDELPENAKALQSGAVLLDGEQIGRIEPQDPKELLEGL